ncbi:MAG TPA: hypothetical protein VJ785_01855 [Anaerolineales bacterium]|nr:hypothetical protein [Anaerolineales bacterium]
MQSDISLVLPLNHIDELFTAPVVDPFSTHEVDVFGQSAMACIRKRVTRLWPRRPKTVQVTLRLPADQVTPILTEKTRAAVQRYCTDSIAANRLQRGIVIQRALRQFSGAMIGMLVVLLLLALLMANPFGLLPEILRGILIVLSSFAIAVLIFDGLWSLVFDWLPFVQDNTVHTVLMDMELRIEAHSGEERGGDQ